MKEIKVLLDLDNKMQNVGELTGLLKDNKVKFNELTEELNK